MIFGSPNFLSILNELKPYLKFNIISSNENLMKSAIDKDKILICDTDFIEKKKNAEFIKNCLSMKILLSEANKKYSDLFDATLYLPTTVKEINKIVEELVAKNKFEKNSSIKIKDYKLDKNERKLNRNGISLILTEKEIHLLEILLKNQKAISKSEILSLVWHYASDADTHTVETHIYRLRKKISEKFNDEKFILNNKEGYYL